MFYARSVRWECGAYVKPVSKHFSCQVGAQIALQPSSYILIADWAMALHRRVRTVSKIRPTLTWKVICSWFSIDCSLPLPSESWYSHPNQLHNGPLLIVSSSQTSSFVSREIPLENCKSLLIGIGVPKHNGDLQHQHNSCLSLTLNR